MRKRNYGLDLLRIISMCMVFTLHILGQGGILSAVTPYTVNYRVAWLLEICSFGAVNCYGLFPDM